MHQSGQERAHSMQTVQFSSFNAMTPRARAAGSSRSCGYCTVTAGFIIVLNVMPRPPITPGSLGFFMSACPSDRHLEHARQQDVEEADGDEELPRQGLQLVLTETRIGEAHPEHEEGDGHDLGEEHERPEE